MRVSRFLLILGLLTLFSLLYVRQQTEIFRLAYLGQKNLSLFEDLLDKNTILRYNIGKRASLVRIGDKVCKEADFQMPDTFRLVKLSYPERSVGVRLPAVKKESLFSRVFGIKRQAEAKTINP